MGQDLLMWKIADDHLMTISGRQQRGQAPLRKIGRASSTAEHQDHLRGNVRRHGVEACTVTEWRLLSADVPVLGSIT